MTTFWVGNIYLVLSMLFGAASQIVFKALFNETGPLQWSLTQLLNHPGAMLKIFIALALLAGAFVAWMMTLSRLDLSYAYPIASSSALLVTLLSFVFLGETVTGKMWFGTVLIVLGTALLVPSR